MARICDLGPSIIIDLDEWRIKWEDVLGKEGRMEVGDLSRERVEEVRDRLRRGMTVPERLYPEEGRMEGQAEKVERFNRALAEGKRVAEMDGRHEETSQEVEEGRHYGVWHPKQGWWWKLGGELYVTRHKSLAQAQCSAVHRFEWPRRVNAKDYRVRCIEEWAEEVKC